MNRVKLIISLLIIAISLVLSIGLHLFPVVERDTSSSNFSAVRAAMDIKAISAEPHSIEHPIARQKVRDYLVERLRQLGAAATLYTYDSIKTRLGTDVQITNIFSKIEPSSGPSDSYIMLIAHYDSRFRLKKGSSYVYSFGAADDGYGVASILELLNIAGKYKDSWRRGVKILFTDSEENELDGMRSAYDKNRELFDKVDFIINIEARGVKGPALMFETSPNNSKIAAFYASTAKYPIAFSLTSAIYRSMPNFTDFYIVKDHIPGVNFAAIDNLDYYHTNLDNYNNINLRTIQHYGVQAEPMLHKYLTSDKLESGYFSSDQNSYFITLPFIGVVLLSKVNQVIANVLVLLLLFITVMVYNVQRRCNLKKVLLSGVWVFIILLFSFALGYGLSRLAAMLWDVKFNFTYMPYIKYDYIVLLLSFCSILSFISIIYKHTINKIGYSPYDWLFGVSAVMLIIAGILLFTIGENILLIVPLATLLISLFLNIIRFAKFTLLISMLVTTTLLSQFLYLVHTALTIGSLSITSVIFGIIAVMIIPTIHSFSSKIAF